MKTPEDILSAYDDDILTLGLQLRAFVLKKLKHITEEADAAANIIGYGYGPGYKGMVCTIIPSKKGMKVGFYKGTELHDPTNLLTGSGKVHKYVEIKTKQDILNPALSELLKEAAIACKKRIAMPKTGRL